jgi:VIT1/CCC1 family predicted Fe2+/Mn2+ transporter
MSRLRPLRERHFVNRIGWLRAAVLGANDGIISTASLIVGVAAAAATQNDVLIAGVAGLVAGAMSMAAGEYVSVSSQSDSEQADLKDDAKLVKSAWGIRQVLFEAFGDYQLRVAYCLREDQHRAAARRTNCCGLPCHGNYLLPPTFYLWAK